jgi:hypothetical protein
VAFFYSNGKDDRPLELFKIIGRIAVEGGHEANKVLEGVGKAAKLVAAGVAAGATAVAALTKQAVESYAEFEQLAGGAAKIFDQMDQAKILSDAQNAYKELNMSASEYLAVMNDVGATFAATMGDAAGYDAAKTGLKAISDYASGTGKNITELSQKFTLITRSTSSYQSIADQFSGILPATSAEFLKQAKAAGVLSNSYTKLTEVPIDEYQAAVAKMLERGVDALGLTNNTANEAFTTISGSLAMTKAAWKNLLVGMADDTADMEKLVDQFVEAVGAAAENIIPRIEAALEGTGKLIDRLFPLIIEKIPKIITDTLPKILDSAVNIVKALVRGISDNKDTIMRTIFDVIMVIVQTTIELLPEIIALGLELILAIAEGIIENLDALIDSVVEVIWKIVEILTEPDNLDKLLDATLEIILKLAEGLVEFLPELIEASVEIIKKLVEYLLEEENLNKIIDAALTLLETLVTGLLESTGVLVEAAVDICAAFITAILNVNWWDVGKKIITGIGEGLVNSWTSFQQNHPWVAELFSNVGASISAGGYGNAMAGAYNLPSHASGLDYVPYDGYVAELHKGEMVVPASEARMLRGETRSAESSKVESLLTMILGAVQEGNMREPVLKFKEREVARMVREYA